MAVRRLVITSLLLCTVTQSQYYPTTMCQVEKRSMGGRAIVMEDGSEIRGIKVEFTTNTSCYMHLKRGVEEFRGLHYGVIKVSDKVVLRFMKNKSTVRSPEKQRFATNHKPVCPQVKIDPESEHMSKQPNKFLNRLRKIGKFTHNQSEECLWLNIFVPNTGK